MDFEQTHSTETAILQFVNYVYTHLERKCYVAGLFIDLSKAFDSLNHKILIDKFEYMGIRGVPQKRFKSYIDNRSQSVYCNSTYSLAKSVSKGVTQESILGPIHFFNIY